MPAGRQAKRPKRLEPSNDALRAAHLNGPHWQLDKMRKGVHVDLAKGWNGNMTGRGGAP